MLSFAAAASAPLRTMSQNVSPGAAWVITATFMRGVVAWPAAGCAAAPAAAGGWVGCDGATPALHAIAATARPPAIATHRARLPDVNTVDVPVMSVAFLPVDAFSA